jgi:hypothetical protein
LRNRHENSFLNQIPNFLNIYNKNNPTATGIKLETTQIIRLLLAFTDLVLIAMAIFRIRQRHLYWFDTTAWLLLTLLVPFLGPFITILQRCDPHFNKEVERSRSKNKAR